MKNIIIILSVLLMGSLNARFVPDGKGGKIFCNPKDTVYDKNGTAVGCKKSKEPVKGCLKNKPCKDSFDIFKKNDDEDLF